jgi:uncharacterized membrane protein YqjE
MMEGQADAAHEHDEDDEPGPARALTAHVLRMFETRVDAAGIALQSELQSFSSRLQMRLLAAAALFLALWGGIVLLAIALPPHLRIPVLSAVVVAFVSVGIWAYLAANRAVSSRDVGSMTWFMENIRLDVEVLSRSLAKSRVRRQSAAPTPEQPTPEADRSDPNDLAA